MLHDISMNKNRIRTQIYKNRIDTHWDYPVRFFVKNKHFSKEWVYFESSWSVY